MVGIGWVKRFGVIVLCCGFCTSVVASVCSVTTLHGGNYFAGVSYAAAFDPIWTYRSEVVASQQRYIVDGCIRQWEGYLIVDGRSAWQSISGEFPYLSIDAHRGQAVIYLGSASDVVAPLVDFPLAGHYHFVDKWTSGVGPSPTVELNEIPRRLLAIYPDAQITIRQMGFLASYPSEALPSYPSVPFDPDAEGPAVIEVRGTSASLGFQRKTFYLHRADYNVAGEIGPIIEKTTEGVMLTGVLAKGGTEPTLQTLAALRKKLAPTGEVILSGYGNSDGGREWPGYRTRKTPANSPFPFSFHPALPRSFREGQQDRFGGSSLILSPVG